MKKVIIIELILIVFLSCCNLIQFKNPKIETVVETKYETTETQIVVPQRTNKSYDYCCLKFIPILQNPELPTGCEVTSLTMVFNYFGCNVDKIELSDNYLDKGEIGITNPNDAFVGNPLDENSFGCYSNVIVNCANAYINNNDCHLSAISMNYSDFKSFEDYIKIGYPVIVWATINLNEAYETYAWDIDGEQVTWLANEHCLVLIGFNNINNTYIFADPLNGIVEYSKDLVIERYDSMGKQAVLIY